MRIRTILELFVIMGMKKLEYDGIVYYDLNTKRIILIIKNKIGHWNKNVRIY